MTSEKYALLYCVTGQHGAFTLRRMEMSGDLQKTVTDHFIDLETNFFEGRDSIEFAPSYDPDSVEYLCIEGFTRPPFLVNAERNPDSFTKYSPSTVQAETPIKALLCVLVDESGGEPSFLFQYFDKRKLLNRTKLTILFRGGQFTDLKETGMMICDHLDAVIRGTTLSFRSFHLVSQFLPLTEYFKEASDDDIRSFVKHEMFSGGDAQAVIAYANQVTRKRISIVLKADTLSMVGISADKIKGAAQKFELDLKLTGRAGKRKIEFPTDPHLVRELLRLLAEGMYVGPISDEPYIANSYRRMRRR